ncbi:Uncharacterised protein [Chryseobacterium nakagawai]|uniref:Uncharacterized protein n=1 Tax=Chryseobacterium nakagawai TaxID=1241982 RepID=A0AAD0YNW5_CHRNA|nr:hypothetical protein [Chryseobacterium nakagawai]AZA92369.1 hypothetical protein EG343_17980 [Chryseobacterium nakagawai]VEH18931.1 Uncharacterised protein [Chryseobacterium nakagawai]
MMENIYFNTLDRFLSIRFEKLKFYIAFFYFPVLIAIAVVCNIISEANGFSLLTILPLVIGAPMLMIPAIYFLRGENYFILREFVKSLDTSHINCDLQSIFKVEAIQLFYQEKLNDLQSVFNFIYHKDNNSQDCLNYKPNKKLSKRSREKLETFYNAEANKYFDVCEYELDFFVELIEGKRSAESNTIHLNEDLSNNDIISLIDAIHHYTGIYQIRIQLLFKRFKKKNNNYENLNWGSMKSSKSQCVSIGKS